MRPTREAPAADGTKRAQGRSAVPDDAGDRRPRDVHSRETRERIVRTAARLIIEKGVANTSLADIARESRISKGTLFYHFPSKADLIFDVSERHMGTITQKIITWVKHSVGVLSVDKMLRMVFDILLTSEKRGQIHVYLIQEALTADSSLRRRFTEAYGQWREAVESGLKQVLGEHKDFKVLSGIIVAAIDGLLIQNLLGAEPVPVDEVCRYLVR